MSAPEPLALVPEVRVHLGVIEAKGPKDLVSQATEMANSLASLIKAKKLYSTINGRDFVRVEGWTTMLAMLGITPHEVSVSDTDGTYTAIVELRKIADGAVVGRASAECGMDEPTWAKRSRYARRSMALTRATGKAARLAFSWIMTLAGYESTPAEEIPDEPGGKPAPQAVAKEPATTGPVWPFGRFKGTPLAQMSSEDLLVQRTWADKNGKGDLVTQIDEELESRRGE